MMPDRGSVRASRRAFGAHLSMRNGIFLTLRRRAQRGHEGRTGAPR
jgi:hypothetical protein